MRKLLGTIQITSGQIVCSDPGYRSGEWCAQTKKALNGEYNVYLTSEDFDKFGKRNTELMIVHKDHDGTVTDDRWILDNHAGVDSGTFGFFDKEYFDRHHEGVVDDAWFDENLMRRIDDPAAVTDGRGVWATAGYGDGSYPVEYAVIPYKHVAVALKVVFIY